MSIIFKLFITGLGVVLIGCMIGILTVGLKRWQGTAIVITILGTIIVITAGYTWLCIS